MCRLASVPVMHFQCLGKMARDKYSSFEEMLCICLHLRLACHWAWVLRSSAVSADCVGLCASNIVVCARPHVVSHCYCSWEG